MVKCSEVWEEGWESFDEVVANISTYLDCFELEKFEAVDSEEQLSKRGLELLDTNQLWGGLVRNSWNNTPKNLKPSSQVFVGLAPGQQELPKFVTYKIRIDADKVGFSQNINITDFNEGGV